MSRARNSNAKFLSQRRLSDPTGPLDPFVEQFIRRMLRDARNPLADAELDLWEDIDGTRAYRANHVPFSLHTESMPSHLRLPRKMRWLVKDDVAAFRDREFAEGRAFSALSGVPLTIENTEVDHCPERFRDISEFYLRQDGMVDPERDPRGFDDWPAFHRWAIGWTGDGQATGLRLLTKVENNRRG